VFTILRSVYTVEGQVDEKEIECKENNHYHATLNQKNSTCGFSADLGTRKKSSYDKAREGEREREKGK